MWVGFRGGLIARGCMCVLVAFALIAWAGAVPQRAEAANGLFPLLDCVTYDEITDTVTARFGYSNTTGVATEAPIEENYFDPPPEYRDQPEVFQPGTFHNVFDATFPAGFDGNGYLTWNLRGSSVTARNDPNIYCPDPGTPDTTPPDTAILDGPRGTVGERTATFDLFSEGGARFECSLDGAPFTPCDDPLQLAGLGDGPHSLQARATDLTGNVDPTPATRTWTVDATSPVPPILGAPANGSIDRDGSFNVRGTAEPDSIVRLYEGAVRLGTAETDPVSGAWLVAVVDVGDGPHTYRARATDPVGNVSADSAPVSLTVDSSSPSVTGFTPSGARKVPRTAVVSARFSEAIDPPSLDAFRALTLTGPGSDTPVRADVRYDATTITATLDPKRKLKRGARYRVELTSAISDSAGNRLEPMSWSFRVKR
jgi:hypothetical protein